MKGLLLVGSGGHAKVVIELFRAMGDRVDYCVGDAHSAQECLGVPILKGDEHIAHLRTQGYTRAFVAIGDNGVRQRLGKYVLELGYTMPNAISPAAHISPTARLGAGIAIMAGVVINAETIINDLVIVNTGATVDHDGLLGEGAHIAPRCGLAGNVTVGPGAFLGIGCSAIPGVSIGQEAIVGAGSVIIRNIPERVIAVGLPARVIKGRDLSS